MPSLPALDLLYDLNAAKQSSEETRCYFSLKRAFVIFDEEF
jgi:hypothetical protein